MRPFEAANDTEVFPLTNSLIRSVSSVVGATRSFRRDSITAATDAGVPARLLDGAGRAALRLRALTVRRGAGYGLAMVTATRVDLLLSTLNATDVGTLESVTEKLRQVQDELAAMDRPELASRAGEAVAALTRGDVSEFKRARAFLQSKIGHLRR